MRRETGKKLIVQVHHHEEVANRIGVESCAAAPCAVMASPELGDMPTQIPQEGGV